MDPTLTCNRRAERDFADNHTGNAHINTRLAPATHAALNHVTRKAASGLTAENGVCVPSTRVYTGQVKGECALVIAQVNLPRRASLAAARWLRRAATCSRFGLSTVRPAACRHPLDASHHGRARFVPSPVDLRLRAKMKAHDRASAAVPSYQCPEPATLCRPGNHQGLGCM